MRNPAIQVNDGGPIRELVEHVQGTTIPLAELEEWRMGVDPAACQVTVELGMVLLQRWPPDCDSSDFFLLNEDCPTIWFRPRQQQVG